MLHRVLCVALLAGFAAGIAATALQMVWTVPLIVDAEVYEHFGGDLPAGGFEAARNAVAAAAAGAGESMLERHAFTTGANILFGTGAALMLAGIFTLLGYSGLKKGLAWGAGGFLAIALAPAIGLPPELPGTMAAELGDRQAWWLGTAALSASGLLVLVYCRQWYLKLLAVAAMVAPHALGAPHPETHETLAPASLAYEFIAASLASSAVFWLILGMSVGLLATRFGLGNENAGVEARTA